jgi:crotonobetainyl-CoA:carnitine CoA-transferase CaiB-like acyl-CoA transferase
VLDEAFVNLLPGARQRFRIDADDLFAVNERLIYGRATGHGDRGPERESGGFDMTDLWARAGIADAVGQVPEHFVPQLGPAFGDIPSGTFLAEGSLPPCSGVSAQGEVPSSMCHSSPRACGCSHQAS